MTDSRTYAMQWLAKRGYSPHAAAALTSHGVQESGLRPDAVGDGGTAFGAFQWRGPRLAGLYRYARENGQDPRALDTQLGFADHELNTTERAAGDALRAAPDIRSAVRAGMMFERPAGYTRDNPEGGHGWDNRLGEAYRLAGQAAPTIASAVAGGPSAVIVSAPAVPPTDVSALFADPGVDIARRRAAAAEQEQRQRQALLAGPDLGGLFA